MAVRPKSKGQSETKRPSDELAEAIAAVRENLQDDGAWTHLEKTGVAKGAAGEVAALYRSVLAEHPELAAALGRRAVDFLDDSGEDPSAVPALLELVFAGAPTEAWALDRLKLAYSSDGRWNDLLGVFDRAIAGAIDDEARIPLLEDASRVAKDFARDLDRAIDFGERLYALRSDARTREWLEKLYQRCGRHDALIALYEAEVATSPPEAAQVLRAKIAAHALTLEDSERAFAVIEEMLAIDPEHQPAFELLERIFTAPSRSIPPPPPGSAPSSSRQGKDPAARSIRQRTALLLKPRYVAAGRSAELVRVLQVELAVASSDAERAATYRELAALQLDTLRDDAGAMEALSQLVVLEPAETSHRRALAAVAARIGREDRRAKILTTAADRATDPKVRAALLVEAAELCRGALAAPPRAIDLYQRVMAVEGLDAQVALASARALSALLAEAGRQAERCEVLEKLARLETDPAARRAALGEVARIAGQDFGDSERAIRAWRSRLDDDAADADAIAGLRQALGAQGRWRELSGVLEGAAAKSPALHGKLLLEAASINEHQLDDVGAAIRCHEEYLALCPDDTVAMERLSALYRMHARRAELLALRRRQVALATDRDERVRLRLDIASVLEETGQSEELVKALEGNLEDSPREPATVERLARVLEALSRFGDLLALWESQAALHSADESSPMAPLLWRKSAELAENRLGDLDRAIADYERAGRDQEALAALARLHERRGDWAGAASALERHLELAPEEARVPILLRLSAAYVTAGRRDAARRKLEGSGEDRSDPRVVTALEELYRADEAWTELADLLVAEARSAADDTRRAEKLAEAAELHLTKRANPALAIPLLEEALPLTENPVNLALTLARAYGSVGRSKDAVELLRARIEAFGSRRPKERAIVHFELAKALVATGERAPAIAELELAVRIDPVNLRIRRALANAAADSGDLDTALNMFRALLLVLPRREEASEITRAEVFLSLADVAERRGDTAEAAECFESAMSMARESEWERAAAERELAARGKHAILADLIAERLDSIADPERAAAACDQLATLYEEHLARPDDAFAARLRAVSFTPTSAPRHTAALALAHASGRTTAYLELASDLCERAKSPEAAHDLHLFLGAAYESVDSLDDAARAYERAERAALELEPHDMGGRRLDQVWQRLDRIYERLRDDEARAPVLERRARASEARGEPAIERAETLYALASIRLRHTETASAGFDVLEQALKAERRPDRAEAAVRVALEADPSNERALRMLEAISRTPGRERSLIEALQRLGELPASPGCLREAAGVAVSINDPAVAEKLLRRYIELVDTSPRTPSPETDSEIGGALLALATLRTKAGDIREAARLKERAAARLDARLARVILLDVAALAAGPLGDLPEAARVYSAIHAAGPPDRAVWEPLLEIHRTLGDVGAFSDLVEEVVLQLDDRQERVRLRIDQAALLLKSGAPKPSRRPTGNVDDDWGTISSSIWPGAIVNPPRTGSVAPRPMSSSLRPPSSSDPAAVLWKVLDDDPTSAEAIGMLTELLERAERLDELARLLQRQLEIEKDGGKAEAVGELATRLATVLERSAREDEAVDAYRVAVDWDPHNRAAHRALMRLSEKRQSPHDAAEAVEALLRLEVGAEAERLALRLASMRGSLDDEAGVRRALEIGLERYPESEALRARLVEAYEQAGNWRELATFYVKCADARTSPADQVEELRLAATILRRELADAQGAATVLERGLAISPSDRSLLLSLVNALSSAGSHERAIQALDRALAPSPEDAAMLLHMRAVLSVATAAFDRALEDLEKAFMLSDGGYAEELATLLGQMVGRAGPREGVDLRLRLAEVLVRLGRADEAARELGHVLTAAPRHKGALTLLATLHGQAGRVDDAIDCYSTLLELEDGESLVEATLAFADLCDANARHDSLRPALERARKFAPDSAEIRRRLHVTYAVLGENRALAALLIDEASAEQDPTARFASLMEAAQLLLDPELGDPQGSIPLLHEAHGLKPEDPVPGLLLADAYVACGKTGDALALLEQLLAGQKRRSKSRSGMHHRLARIYAAMGAQSSALQSIIKAMEDDPHDAALAMEAGLTAVDQNDMDSMQRAFRTVTLMKTAVPGGPPGPAPLEKATAYFHLARVAQLQGDVRKARVLVDKSMAEAPSVEAQALKEALRG